MLDFFHDLQGTACWLGVAAFLGYASLFAFGLQQPPAGAGSKDGDESPVSPKGAVPLTKSAAAGAAAAVGGLAAAVAYLALVPGTAVGVKCPWSAAGAMDDGFRGPARLPWRPGPPPPAANTTSYGPPPPPLRPLQLLALARDLGEAGGAARGPLEACTRWSPADMVGTRSRPPPAAVEDLRAQLQCLRSQAGAAQTDCEEASALLVRAEELQRELTADKGAEVEVGRVASAVLQRCCAGAVRDLQLARRAANVDRPLGEEAAARGVVALGALLRLEPQVRRWRALLDAGIEALTGPAADGDWDAAEELLDLKGARSASRTCLLGAVREARGLAASLPAAAAPVRAAKAACAPELLLAVEQRSLREAAADPDGGAQFGLGLYWSEVAVSGRKVPFFGVPLASSGWRRDARGRYIPEDMARAEALLLRGEQAAVGGSERGDRASMRALRLYQHGKLLAMQHHDEAAEWRLTAAARLAVSYRRPKLAAHALTRLSHFNLLRGRRPEALRLATSALQHERTPLALYLQATLQRELGELRTADDVHNAEEQLRLSANRLPSKTLEENRAVVHAELVQWNEAANGGLKDCLKLGDAAKVLLCSIMRLVLP